MSWQPASDASWHSQSQAYYDSSDVYAGASAFAPIGPLEPSSASWDPVALSSTSYHSPADEQSRSEGQTPSLRSWRQSVQARKRVDAPHPCKRIFCGCFLLFLMLLGIFVTLLVYLLKTPTYQFLGISLPSDPVDLSTTSGLQMRIDANVQVLNPNLIGAFLPNLTIDALYPLQDGISNGTIGGGTLLDVDIPARQPINISFPFQVNSSTGAAPILNLLTDLLNQCQAVGDDQPMVANTSIPYTASLLVRIVGITFPVHIAEAVTFPCALKVPDTIADALKAAGLNTLGDVLGTTATGLLDLIGKRKI